MKGVFIGKNNSMGFKHGKEYDIRLQYTPQDGFLWVIESESGLRCPYLNLSTLLANWDIESITK